MTYYERNFLHICENKLNIVLKATEIFEQQTSSHHYALLTLTLVNRDPKHITT